MQTASFINWDSAYSIGHGKIDSEHKTLFDIANKIRTCENDSSKIMEIVKELISYTKLHFKNEELFMQVIAYKELEEHKIIHKNIIDDLNRRIVKIKSLPLDEIIKLIDEFVYESILKHILLEDKKVHHAIKNREDLKKCLSWKNDYRLENELIDDEHKKLFEIAIKALDYNGENIKEHIKTTINELYVYMKNHFQHEQEYMKSIDYPNFEVHCKLHEEIIEQINSFIKTLPSLKIEEFERKLIEYMDIWLINHILYEDRKIIDFLKK